MTELKTYKQKVRYILELIPKTRNNDSFLIAHYINNFHSNAVVLDENGEKAVPLKNFASLPPLENIRRCRQIIQNDNGELLPTDPKVAEARGIKEQNWRNAEVREAKRII